MGLSEVLLYKYVANSKNYIRLSQVKSRKVEDKISHIYFYLHKYYHYIALEGAVAMISRVLDALLTSY